MEEEIGLGRRRQAWEREREREEEEHNASSISSWHREKLLEPAAMRSPPTPSKPNPKGLCFFF
jgi:hypothetical protein